MVRDKVQFQRGLSDVEFERLYGAEEECCEALFSWRWPEASSVRRVGSAPCRARETCVVAVERLRHPNLVDGGHDLCLPSLI